MKSIPEKNLEKMLSKEEGGMRNVLDDESIGGNAGSYRGFSCYCANFFYNPQNGEIKYFGNWQYVSARIKKHYPKTYFLLAVTSLENHIANDWVVKRGEVSNFSQKVTETKLAKQNLKDTIKLYNKRYGLSPYAARKNKK